MHYPHNRLSQVVWLQEPRPGELEALQMAYMTVRCLPRHLVLATNLSSMEMRPRWNGHTRKSRSSSSSHLGRRDRVVPVLREMLLMVVVPFWVGSEKHRWILQVIQDQENTEILGSTLDFQSRFVHCWNDVEEVERS